jgi:hypothetical protein
LLAARAELRGPFEQLIARIRDDKSLIAQKRFELFAAVLLHNCAQRKIPVRGVGISNERRIVIVEIPQTQEDLSEDSLSYGL